MLPFHTHDECKDKDVKLRYLKLVLDVAGLNARSFQRALRVFFFFLIKCAFLKPKSAVPHQIKQCQLFCEADLCSSTERGTIHPAVYFICAYILQAEFNMLS